jgi:hypothetical protein
MTYPDNGRWGTNNCSAAVEVFGDETLIRNSLIVRSDVVGGSGAGRRLKDAVLRTGCDDSDGTFVVGCRSNWLLTGTDGFWILDCGTAARVRSTGIVTGRCSCS